MDLVQTVRKEGSRGGRADFKWEDVKQDAQRENYLGHSLMAPVGRWQQGRDLNWYAKGNKDEDEQTAAEKLAEEKRKLKEAEEDAMLRAMGLPVPDRSANNANLTPLGKKAHEADVEKAIDGKTKEDDGEGRQKEKKERHRRDRDDEDRDRRRRRQSRSRSRDRERDRDRDRRRDRSRSRDRRRDRERDGDKYRDRHRHRSRSREHKRRDERHERRRERYSEDEQSRSRSRERRRRRRSRSPYDRHERRRD